MKIVLHMIMLFAGFGLFAQTPTTVVKPESGETDYIINSSSGIVDIQATDYILLTPNTHIQEGSTFTARIVDVLDSDGIIINTVNLPDSEFEIVFEGSTLENQSSGGEDSEVFVEIGPDTGSDKILLINVTPSPKSAALYLRITKNQENFAIEVFQDGIWLTLSSSYYLITDNKITFYNRDFRNLTPFRMNLVNGVEYNKINPLVLNIEETIDINNSALVIIGPNNFSININPNIQENHFTWDGTQAQSGVYRFNLQIQGKNFNGQFLIL